MDTDLKPEHRLIQWRIWPW